MIMRNKKYYELDVKVTEFTPFAWQPQEYEMNTSELIKLFSNVDEVPYQLNLTVCTKDRKGLHYSENFSLLDEVFPDYLLQLYVAPLLSERLKQIIENGCTGNEHIKWIKIPVKAGNDVKNYYQPMFLVPLDVIDESNSRYIIPGDKSTIIPCYSLQKLEKFNVFYMNPYISNIDLWKLPTHINISDSIVKEIKAQGIKGLIFRQLTTI